MDFFPQPAQDITEFMRANPNAFGPDATLGMDPNATPYLYEKDSAIAMFYPRAVLDKMYFRETGMQRYMRVPYVQIRQPGEQLNIIDRPAQPMDQMRFASAWERFEKRSNDAPDGTPLGALFPFHPEIIQTLQANGIPTVEALGDMSDSALTTFPFGGMELRAKARQYLLAVTDPNGVKQVQQAEELERLKAQNADLQNLLNAQKEHASSMEERLAALETRRAVLPGGPGDVAAGQAITDAAAATPRRNRS